MNKEQELISEITIFNKYAKYIPKENRRETWKELIDRNMLMHINKFPYLQNEIRSAYQFVLDKKILPSMRSLQFAGKPIEINNSRLYNCCFLHMNDPKAFSEVMFLLLSGCGVGYSVQNHHIDQLPEIKKPTKTKRFLVGDSIEGWADAIKALMKAYFIGSPCPKFDFRDIRSKGERLITSGGKAPGHEGLKRCLQLVQLKLDNVNDRLTSLEVHDILCYIADAVLSGGIRRSAMISLFSFDDESMREAKSGTFYETDPQRFRANNTAVIVRSKATRGEFMKLWEQIEASGAGEPGFMFTNNAEWGLNPCAEISLRDCQFCNLVTINASNITSLEDFNERCAAASFIATLQASYTDFHYLRDKWKKTTEKEALIGVSMTGIATGSVLDLPLEIGAEIVRKTNEEVSRIIGINKAARTTTIKPEGTTSLVLGTSSGVHAWHNDYYLRRIRLGKNEALYTYLSIHCPEILVDCKEKPFTQAIIEVPQKAPESAITRQESPLDLLNRIVDLHDRWIQAGHRKGDNTNNVSATININSENWYKNPFNELIEPIRCDSTSESIFKQNEWEVIGDWAWENKEYYTALSFFPFDSGSYIQAPFEDITKEEYEKRCEILHQIDLSGVIEMDDETKASENLACFAGNCEIK